MHMNEDASSRIRLDGLAIHLRIGSAEFRYVGEYLPGKHGPVPVMGNGGLPAIIFSDPYIMVIIPFAAMQSHATTRYILCSRA